MGTLYINSSKGKTLRSLIQAARSGTGIITSNGDGTVTLGDGPVAAPAYTSYAAVVSALPPGIPGRMASIPMIGGTGRAILVDNGTAWVLKRGQMLVDEWVEVTAVGTALVVAKTWAIPVGVFGDQQEMVGIIFARGASGYVSGTDSIRLRNEEFGAAGGLLSAITMAGTYPRVARGVAEIYRDGSNWIAVETSAAPNYNNVVPNVRGHNWANPWTLGLTVQAGAAGHVIRVNVKFGRI